MNFLAHLHLADQCWPGDGPALIGSILPDLARPRRISPDLPPTALAAVTQHRAVDAFTDTHDLVARSKQRLRAKHGRYTAILVDVFYDHLLARAWTQYAATPLPEFVAQVHRQFVAHAALMPETMRYPAAKLIEEDWLTRYASIEGIHFVLERMSRRLSRRFERDIALHDAVPDLAACQTDLAADFTAFYPQLMAHAGASPRA